MIAITRLQEWDDFYNYSHHTRASGARRREEADAPTVPNAIESNVRPRAACTDVTRDPARGGSSWCSSFFRG